MNKKRVWQIDFLRGVAIILMIGYHLIYDLIQLAKVEAFVHDDFYHYGPHVISSLFLFVVGLSLSESFSKKTKFEKFVRKGIRVFCWGLFLTAGTVLSVLVFGQKNIILFGILHCIGFSILLSFLFFKLEQKQLLLSSIIIIVLGFFLEKLGVHYYLYSSLRMNILKGYQMPDFFPIIPWFGFLLLGVYCQRRWGVKIARFANSYQELRAVKGGSFLGRHSLLIYILHQPVLIIGLYLFGMLS